MNNKKRSYSLASSLLLPLFLFCATVLPISAQAYTLTFDDSSKTLATTTLLGTKDPAYIVFTVVNTGLIFLGMITVIIVIAAGFMWIFAAGVEEKITKAKDLLKGAVIGLVIVLMSYGLSQYVFTVLVKATQPDAPITSEELLTTEF